MRQILTVAKKELSTYFSSPVAFIFLGTFLVVTMFVFFWVEAFFARNIVDVRPLFDWMPLLLIFLVAALTMKMWSEERRMGTLEFLLTVPVKTHHLVFGKFLACMGLVTIALVLTLGVPVTVSLMGDLDWGPVFGAYLAALLLAGSYTAIGLFVSSRSESQIVSLILTTVICYVLYLLGSQTLGSLVNTNWGEYFKLVGTGSRFESINRGVIDIRDLYYYLSLIGVFLTLNTYSLEKLKWSERKQGSVHSLWKRVSILLVANFIIANFWLHRTNMARVDLTEGNIYSISEATHGFIDQIQEPLLIRGYFSSKTHPLLAPLVPRIRDLINEYSIESEGKIRAEFLDPKDDRDLEAEANQKYNIKPLPFQISDRYQASLVNSYFNVLIQYGDKWEVLGFRDLIEVKPGSTGQLDVRLRNPEYDVTRSIKKVLYGFKDTGTLFASLPRPLTFTGFISAPENLPGGLSEFRSVVEQVVNELKTESGGKLNATFVDPAGDQGKVAAEINEKFGFRPMATSLFDPNQFYFYMLLQDGDRVVPVPLPENLTEDGARQTIESALKRFSPGFLKTVGLHTSTPPQQPWMQQMGGGASFRFVQEKLEENYSLSSVDLSKGIVQENIDIIVSAGPKDLTEKELFAVDQFLMKGGTVILSTSPFSVSQQQTGVTAQPQNSGLSEWLKGYGIEIEKKLVLDSQNEPYPVPVQRNLGGFSVQELRMVNYPHWVDIRPDGMNQDNAISTGIPQVTLNWPSQLLIDKEVNKDRTVIPLFNSSKDSWVSEQTKLEPNFQIYPQYGFPVDGEQKPRQLAAIVEGVFESFFKGKDSPLLKEDKKPAPKGAPPTEEKAEPVIGNIIEQSTGSARIIVFASNEFLNDQTLQISAASGSSRYLNSLQVLENAIDWSVEDRALLSIRSRGQFSRTMYPMTDRARMFWEYGNYALILFGLILVLSIYKVLTRKSRTHHKAMLHA